MEQSLPLPSNASTYSRYVDLVVCHGKRFPDFEGLEIRAFLPDQLQYEAVTGKLYPALRLFADHMPLRFNYLQRDLPRIFVGITPAAGSCVRAVGVCLIGTDYLIKPETSPARLAMTLVHEGTHARLLRLGVGYDESIRARIERICIRSEILFVRRLKKAEELEQAALRRLRWPDRVWSDAARKARVEAYFKSLGASGVVARIVVWLSLPILRLVLRWRRRTAA
jgi:hypothetical protein